MSSNTTSEPRPNLAERAHLPVVVVAGASGYIGQALVKRLRPRFRVVGLSRRRHGPCRQGLVDEWRRCDLYSLKDATDGLAGADYVVYLVHSMLPQDRLTQGRFADLDILLADNFARAARAACAKQIIYLGGIVPDYPNLSEHLSSRREVEDVLRGAQMPLTILRAGLIVGADGSSSQILGRLVRRLPVMVCPPWTRSQTQPVVLEDVIDLLTWATAQPRAFGQTFDLAGDEVMTYLDLIRKTARALGKPARLINFPVGTPFMSALWVRMVTGAPLSLLRPLIESLRHDMTAGDHRIWS
ncbi:MAG: NAD-dependent epimerase/dehydratase family protein, partial [Myxococcota bacterium]|nr:NAD-dependent epimerase/dehydratase family protein [Myxococcota bacterium]